MRLHEDRRLFADAVRITSEQLGIAPEFVEKDYWICQIPWRLSRHKDADRLVWKGGTSLSKAYGLIKHFSSDVDIAVLSDGLSQNQLKRLVTHVGRDIVADLTETDKVGQPIKNNRYRKTYHQYETVIRQRSHRYDFLGDHIIVEINTYGNPYPYVRKRVRTFIADMMERQGTTDLMKSMDMEAFTLNVLDCRRTLCEKVVSLLRFSFDDDPLRGLTSKIRHFYDLHFLMQEPQCQEYLRSDFAESLLALIKHDKEEFDRPPKWREADLKTSVLFTDFDVVWQKLAPIYQSEVGALSYGEIPDKDTIADSMRTLLKQVLEILQGEDK